MAKIEEAAVTEKVNLQSSDTIQQLQQSGDRLLNRMTEINSFNNDFTAAIELKKAQKDAIDKSQLR
jgi:hypothetical protein